MTDWKAFTESWATERIKRLLEPMRKVLPERFMVAGGCFGNDVNDIDLFPCDGWPLKLAKPALCLSKTRNAETYKIRGQVVQLCNYHKDSLVSLVESFDFAHVQIGAKVANDKQLSVVFVDFTDAFVASRCVSDSWYVGSDYPLSSLVRLGKYRQRGIVSKGRAIQSTIDIVIDIVERGLLSYEDFKDQLDAVDLGLVPEDMKDIQLDRLTRLYKLLNKGSQP